MKKVNVLALMLVVALLVGCAHRHIRVAKDVSKYPEVVLDEFKGGLISKDEVVKGKWHVPETGVVLSLFDYDKWSLSQAAKNHLAKVAGRASALSIILEGHCDERGTESYNLALGQRRADVVKQYLSYLGVKNITTISYGKEKPLAKGHDENSWRQNRCVVLKLQK